MTDIIASDLLFDYASIPDDSRDVARTVALDIKPRLRRAAEDVIAVGRGLIRAKAALPHGFFGKWAYDEFGLTAKTTERFVDVAQLAERMGAESDNLSHLLPSVLYELAKPSTPAKAVENVLKLSATLAETGERVTVKQARGEIRRLRQPTQTNVGGAHIPLRKAGEGGAASVSTGDSMPATPTAICRRCHRPLSDPATAAAGIGHICATHEQRGGGGDGEGETTAVAHTDEMPVYESIEQIVDYVSDDDVWTPAQRPVLTPAQKRGAANLLRTIGYGVDYFQPHPADRELGIEHLQEAAWEAIQALIAELEAISQ